MATVFKTLPQMQAAIARLPRSTGPLKPFVPAIEGLANSLAGTGGSLNQCVNGKIIRVGSNADAWDINKEWHGPELIQYVVRNSLWTKSIQVTFYPVGTLQAGLFTLSLAPPLTPEEIATSADTYMMLLNLVRKE